MIVTTVTGILFYSTEFPGLERFSDNKRLLEIRITWISGRIVSNADNEDIRAEIKALPLTFGDL